MTNLDFIDKNKPNIQESSKKNDNIYKNTKLAFNEDAERAVLGALLFDNEVYYKIDELKSEHFYNPLNQKLFSIIAKLIDSGRLASPVTVNSYISDDIEFLEKENYLADLLEATPYLSAAPEYAKLIYELSVYRGLAQIGSDLTEKAIHIDTSKNSSHIIDETEQSLYTLAQKGRYGNGFEEFVNPVDRAIEIAKKAKERGGGISGIATGLVDIDKMLGGLQNSDLIILAGRPSMGKTALATNFAVNAAFNGLYDNDKGKYKPAKIAFFSLEMSSDQIAMRILAEKALISSDRIRRGSISDLEYDKLQKISQDIFNLPLYIDDTGGITINQLIARARRLKRQKGLDLIIIDYLQLLTGSKKTDNRVNEITEITTSLKALAKELNVPVLALSQLSRKVEEREDKKPQLADLRESGSIEQDADVVMFVYREEYYMQREEPQTGTDKHEIWEEQISKIHGLANVIISKQRHGPIGTVNLHFDATHTKFSNLAKQGMYPETD